MGLKEQRPSLQDHSWSTACPQLNNTVPSLHMCLQLISLAPRRARLLRRALYTHLPSHLNSLQPSFLHTTSPIYLLPLISLSPDQSGFSSSLRFNLSAASDSSSLPLNLSHRLVPSGRLLLSVGSVSEVPDTSSQAQSSDSLSALTCLLALTTTQTLMMSPSRSLLLSLNSTQIQPTLYGISTWIPNGLLKRQHTMCKTKLLVSTSPSLLQPSAGTLLHAPFPQPSHPSATPVGST